MIEGDREIETRDFRAHLAFTLAAFLTFDVVDRFPLPLPPPPTLPGVPLALPDDDTSLAEDEFQFVPLTLPFTVRGDSSSLCEGMSGNVI